MFIRNVINRFLKITFFLLDKFPLNESFRKGDQKKY